MAQQLAFHYLPGDSPLHRWDARCKLGALLLVTFGLLHATGLLLALLSFLAAGLIVTMRVPVRALTRNLKGWLLFLGVIFLLQVVGGTDTTSPPLLPWLPVSRERLILGATICWRLALILLFGVLFNLATKPRDLQRALIWMMQPVPFLPAQRIALMATLTLRLLPLTLDHLEEVSEANRSRLSHQQPNLLRRIKYLALPLLRRSFMRADELACALAARGYREDLKVTLPPVPFSHLATLAALTACTALCLLSESSLLEALFMQVTAFLPCSSRWTTFFCLSCPS
jgi:energy-coupling factor transporter transmembrane protein EcfT